MTWPAAKRAWSKMTQGMAGCRKSSQTPPNISKGACLHGHGVSAGSAEILALSPGRGWSKDKATHNAGLRDKASLEQKTAKDWHSGTSLPQQSQLTSKTLPKPLLCSQDPHFRCIFPFLKEKKKHVDPPVHFITCGFTPSAVAKVDELWLAQGTLPTLLLRWRRCPIRNVWSMVFRPKSGGF